MTDIYKPINDDRHASSIPEPSTAYGSNSSSSDAGRTVLAAVVGGVVSAAGYLVYSRLPDDQRDKLRTQVRGLVESRVNELRGRFNL